MGTGLFGSTLTQPTSACLRAANRYLGQPTHRTSTLMQYSTRNPAGQMTPWAADALPKHLHGRKAADHGGEALGIELTDFALLQNEFAAGP